jgi:hypothetical protein
MKQYLLSVYQPEGTPPAPEVLGKIMQDLDELNREMKSTGVWVFSGGLNHPSTATVLRLDGGGILTTDGPFAEGKEYLGGFTIINAADLDAALGWGRKLAQVVPLPIEVRPFADER